MKLHLPTKLRTALMGLAAAVAPFALTVATVSSVAVFAGVAQAEEPEEPEELDNLTLSGTQQNVSAHTKYGTVTVTGTSTISFGENNNKNLIIKELDIGADASLTIQAYSCELVVVEKLTGAGDLSLNRTVKNKKWGYSLAIKGDGTGYTGTISTQALQATAKNATQVYLMGENSAKNAVINLGNYTTLGVSTPTAKIAGLNGMGSQAAVISFANPNATQGAGKDEWDTEDGNCYKQDNSRDVNDETLRTLELTGKGEYSYAGRIGSETNADNLNLTVALGAGGSQTLSGTNYINDLTVTSGDLVLSGATTVGGKASVREGGTLSINGNASITIADGGSFTTGNETVTGLAAGTAAVISGTGLVSVATEGITYTNADIVVRTENPLETAATLANSKLTVTGGGSVKTKVAEDSTNSFDATAGDVNVSTGTSGTTQVETLTVGAGNTASFATEVGDTATIIVTEAADVAGTVSANVTVQSGDADNKATFTAQEGATVDGWLTVTSTGTLEISSPQAENTPALTVSGTLELQAGSVLDLSDLVTKQETGVRMFDIAEALSFDIHQDTTVLGLDGFSWRLTNSAGDTLLGSPDCIGTDTAAPAMFSMRSTMDTLTLTVLGQADAPVTLTATEVISYDPAVNVLDIAVAEDLSLLEGRNLAVSVGSTAWDSIVEAMGDVNTNATITLNGLSLEGFETVSFNGYTGTGTKGEYFVAYIPEPATATLSLLALAALAARRRRK